MRQHYKTKVNNNCISSEQIIGKMATTTSIHRLVLIICQTWPFMRLPLITRYVVEMFTSKATHALFKIRYTCLAMKSIFGELLQIKNSV